MQDLFDRTLNILNARITEFHHFMTLRANEMIVLFVPVRFFVLRKVFSKLMLANQIALYQQIQGIIDSSTTYAVILVLHADV
jgi:hypothetical protein